MQAETSQVGHEYLVLTCASGHSQIQFEWPDLKYNGRSFFCFVSRVIGLSRHWDGLGSTSAMWLIADDGGIEQPDGNILHQ